jgi:hypothetical protein
MRRLVAAVTLAWAVVAACNPQTPPLNNAGPTTVIELLGGPKSATDYSREITAREVTLATGAVRSWSLGVDFGASQITLAPKPSEPPAAYLLGLWGVSDLGIFTFQTTGPRRISSALQKGGSLGQVIHGLAPELALAPNNALFANDDQDVLELNLDGTVVHRWPIPVPLTGTYRGPSARGRPDGHTLFGWAVVLDSAGAPFVWATNGLNGVLVDLKRGRRTEFPGLGYAGGFGFRADGKAFAIAASFEPIAPGTNPGFCGPASNYCDFKSTESVIEFDTRTMQLVARYPMPTPQGALFIGSSTVEVIQPQETYTTLLTLDERQGTFTGHRIPLGAWGLFASADWAGNIYLVSHPVQEDVSTASGPRLPAFQDRVMVYDQASGTTSDAMNSLQPSAGQEVLGFLFRS